MKYRLAVLIFCFQLIVATPSFAEANVHAEANVQTQPVAQTPEEPRPVLAVPPGYHYETHGRRDPFVNPIPKPPPVPVVVEVKPDRPPGLKGAYVNDVS